MLYETLPFVFMNNVAAWNYSIRMFFPSFDLAESQYILFGTWSFSSFFLNMLNISNISSIILGTKKYYTPLDRN
jgi:hypothetical protein